MEDNITLEISEVGEAESKEEAKEESKAESKEEAKAKSKEAKAKDEELEVSFQIAEKARKLNEFILTKWKRNKNVDDFTLSAYIIEHELMPYICKRCKLDSIWNNKPLNLVLDRINNRLNDNRLENLRFLCPNCYSQIRKKQILLKQMCKNKKNSCMDCGKVIKYNSTRCKRCINKIVVFRSSELYDMASSTKII